MDTRGVSRRGAALVLALVLSGAAGCGGGIRALWTGSGEISEARFYSFQMNLSEKKPFATFRFKDGGEMLLAVCALTEKDGKVEFKMDIDARAASCNDMRQPVRFVGEFGKDVLAGDMVDTAGRSIGIFRAFRVDR